MFQALPDFVETTDTLTVPMTEVFNVCRIYCAADDIESHHDFTTINVLLSAAISAAETKLNYDLRVRTWKYTGFAFETLPLRKYPFKELVSVKYYDTENIEQDLSSTIYHIEKFSNDTAYLKFKSGLPEVYDRHDAVSVTFKSGTDVLKADIKLAILLIVSQFYDDRSNGKQTMPTAADALLRPHRKFNF